MKRYSSLSKSNDGKRNSRWSRSRGRSLEKAGYSLLQDTDDPGSGDVIPLNRYKNELCLERQLQPGDTLQSLALEFNCSTAELKRVNRILKDNEIFALRVVKIPARCYSLLTAERLPSVHTACSLESSRGQERDVSVDVRDPLAKSQDLQVVGGDASSLLEDDTIETAAGQTQYNGADWGLSWLALLLCVLLLGFVYPLVYVIYIKLHNKKKT